jgi:hypothetical protein
MNVIQGVVVYILCSFNYAITWNVLEEEDGCECNYQYIEVHIFTNYSPHAGYAMA